MKLFRYTLINFLVINLLIIFGSCIQRDQLNPDPCAETNCENLFLCINGECICPDGYKVWENDCIPFTNNDFVQSSILGNTSCFKELYVLTKIPPPISLNNDWEEIWLHTYSRSTPFEDTMVFENVDPLDSILPITGEYNKVYDYYIPTIGNPCELDTPPQNYVQVKWKMTLTYDTIELTARYKEYSSGETLSPPTSLVFERFDQN